MTQNEIIEMLEAEWRDRLKAAVLDEREACAQMCEALDRSDETAYRDLSDARVCAAAIRARSEA